MRVCDCCAVFSFVIVLSCAAASLAGPLSMAPLPVQAVLALAEEANLSLPLSDPLHLTLAVPHHVTWSNIAQLVEAGGQLQRLACGPSGRPLCPQLAQELGRWGDLAPLDAQLTSASNTSDAAPAMHYLIALPELVSVQASPAVRLVSSLTTSTPPHVLDRALQICLDQLVCADEFVTDLRLFSAGMVLDSVTAPSLGLLSCMTIKDTIQQVNSSVYARQGDTLEMVDCNKLNAISHAVDREGSHVTVSLRRAHPVRRFLARQLPHVSDGNIFVLGDVPQSAFLLYESLSVSSMYFVSPSEKQSESVQALSNTPSCIYALYSKNVSLTRNLCWLKNVSIHEPLVLSTDRAGSWIVIVEEPQMLLVKRFAGETSQRFTVSGRLNITAATDCCYVIKLRNSVNWMEWTIFSSFQIISSVVPWAELSTSPPPPPTTATPLTTSPPPPATRLPPLPLSSHEPVWLYCVAALASLLGLATVLFALFRYRIRWPRRIEAVDNVAFEMENTL